MAFCSNCGTQLADNVHICTKCGTDQTAKAGGAPAAAPMPVAGQPVQQYIPAPPGGMPPAMPGQYPPPMGPAPLAAMPPAAPLQNQNKVWMVVIGAAVVFGIYHFYYEPKQQQQQQQQQQQPQGQQPQGQQPQGQQPQGQQPQGQQPQGQQPQGQQPQGQQPGQQGGQQAPPTCGGSYGNDAVTQAQKFSCTAEPQNGQVVISNGVWTNGANVTVQAAQLGCLQYDQNMNAISGTTWTQNVNGPLAPGQSQNFQPFQIGAVQQTAYGAACAIIQAQAATQ